MKRTRKRLEDDLASFAAISTWLDACGLPNSITLAPKRKLWFYGSGREWVAVPGDWVGHDEHGWYVEETLS